MSERISPAFLRAVSTELPGDIVSRDPKDLEVYGRDWTRVYEPAAGLLVLPRTTEQVATLLRLCTEHGVPVVPSGGRTGLAGGALARDGEVVLSLDRMRRMDPVDTVGMTVRVQAGAVTEAVHNHAEAHGLTWPVDFASKGSSQIGGNIATNAGGVRVIHYGLTRTWVLGLEVVTPTGQVLEIDGALEKNNTGIDLRQLFIGSEGILGVITEATLKLVREPGALDVFLFALPNMASVLGLFKAARNAPFSIMAYEFFTDRCVARVERHLSARNPLETKSSHYVLLEVEAHDREALESWLESLFEQELVLDGTLAQSGVQSRELWTLREGISESLFATGLPHKNDIALPIAALPAFCEQLEALLAERYPDWELCLFGHIGDGNLHVNVMKPEGMEKETFLDRVHDVDIDLFDLVRSHKGSVSAEHGIGVLKREWLGHSRSEEEIALMRGIKALLDPKGVLNPGKVL